ncbi:MAG TPA: helix-turn-helix domain-containing protein [Anaerolineae bacterium]|nr:helix-turn-helix domain-containing protein [Anaerolineae bacterium]
MDILGNDAISVDVGSRLRGLRQERGMSMRALARASGLSANALSMIERGRSSPSVSTLYKLSEAMEIPITAFFRDLPPKNEIVFRKAEERTRVPFLRGVWEGLGGEFFVGRMEPFMLTLESGASSGPFGIVHSGHEFVLCIRGQLEYIVGNKRFILDTGDSLLFVANLRHRWRNPGKTVTNAIFVVAEFEQDERPGEFHISSGKKGNIEVVDEENEN